MKENPCKLTIYGGFFIFLVHSKNKHIKAFFSVYYSVYLITFNVRYTYLVNNSLFISILHLDLLLLEI